jgi:GNAT superfamily N-acetyltransferase
VDASRIELRKGEKRDFEFLWRLQCESMRPNVERQFGPWNEAFQRELFDSSTDPASHEIIELDHEPIGCQWVRCHSDALELVRLQLLPAAQRRGIGTELIQRLLRRAVVARVPVRLQVFCTSPARDLYARLGFRTVSRTATHESMEHAAQQADEADVE